jgi:hypothetical protein
MACTTLFCLCLQEVPAGRALARAGRCAAHVSPCALPAHQFLTPARCFCCYAIVLCRRRASWQSTGAGSQWCMAYLHACVQVRKHLPRPHPVRQVHYHIPHITPALIMYVCPARGAPAGRALAWASGGVFHIIMRVHNRVNTSLCLHPVRWSCRRRASCQSTGADKQRCMPHHLALPLDTCLCPHLIRLSCRRRASWQSTGAGRRMRSARLQHQHGPLRQPATSSSCRTATSLHAQRCWRKMLHWHRYGLLEC